jgi:hypothetical protein
MVTYALVSMVQSIGIHLTVKGKEMSLERKAELDAIIASNNDAIRAANLELSKMKAANREEANKQLAAIVKSIEELYADAVRLANEFQLEFCIEGDDLYHDFDTYASGNWQESTC